MKRILVLCLRDWLNPRAGDLERYSHEVFSRIAALGNYVAWVSHDFSSWPKTRPSRPQIEFVDGIQVARLGLRWFYCRLVTLLLSRLTKPGASPKKFDVVVDCVNGQPLDAATQLGIPVIPLIFNLSAKVSAVPKPPGPVIAATTLAQRQLVAAGMDAKFVVRAPYGINDDLFSHAPQRDDCPRLVADEKTPGRPLAALKRLRDRHPNLAIDLLTSRRRRIWVPGVTLHLNPSSQERASLYRRAWLGYCGSGAESEALAMAACGIPAMCPDTPAGQEFVLDGRTGLLYTPGDKERLVAQLNRLLRDEVLRTRLAMGARDHAQTKSWDTTASLILSTIENL